MGTKKVLSDLSVGTVGKITGIAGEETMKRRLWDLGFTNGTMVEAIQKAPSSDPVAYRVRGTIIAIRNKDAENISITTIED